MGCGSRVPRAQGAPADRRDVAAGHGAEQRARANGFFAPPRKADWRGATLALSVRVRSRGLRWRLGARRARRAAEAPRLNLRRATLRARSLTSGFRTIDLDRFFSRHPAARVSDPPDPADHRAAGSPELFTPTTSGAPRPRSRRFALREAGARPPARTPRPAPGSTGAAFGRGGRAPSVHLGHRRLKARGEVRDRALQHRGCLLGILRAPGVAGLATGMQDGFFRRADRRKGWPLLYPFTRLWLGREGREGFCSPHGLAAADGAPKGKNLAFAADFSAAPRDATARPRRPPHSLLLAEGRPSR